MNDTLKVLTLVLGSIQVLDIIISYVLYKVNENNKLYLYAIFLWICMSGFFISDFALGELSLYHPLLSFAMTIPASYCVYNLTAQLFSITVSNKIFLHVSLPLYLVGVILYFMNIQAFWLIALPVSMATAIPCIKIAYLSLKKINNIKNHGAIDYIYLGTIFIWCLHFMDYPFLRPLTNVKFSIFGFSFALALTYTTSVMIPVVVNRHILGRINDILEEKLLIKSHELDLTNAKLFENEKLASLGTLSAGVAHEIRNPLNLIKNSAILFEMYLRDINSKLEKLDKEQSLELKDLKNANELIYANIDRIDGIINLILGSSRKDTETIEDISIKDLITNTLNLLATSYDQKHKIRISKDISFKDSPIIRANEGELSRVFINIFENSLYAIKARFGNENKGLIEVSGDVHDNRLQIKIRDNGVGLSKAQLKKVFEPFFTTKQGRQGTGLGMYLVYDILKKYKGQISIKSEQGEYTEVLIILPI